MAYHKTKRVKVTLPDEKEYMELYTHLIKENLPYVDDEGGLRIKAVRKYNGRAMALLCVEQMGRVKEVEFKREDLKTFIGTLIDFYRYCMAKNEEFKGYEACNIPTKYTLLIKEENGYHITKRHHPKIYSFCKDRGSYDLILREAHTSKDDVLHILPSLFVGTGRYEVSMQFYTLQEIYNFAHVLFKACEIAAKENHLEPWEEPAQWDIFAHNIFTNI